jgi:hypothetical protein
MGFAENYVFKANRFKKVWQSYTKNLIKPNFHQISVNLFLHHGMKHHKSGICAISFHVIYTRCTLPTVQVIGDDFIQLAVWRNALRALRQAAGRCASAPKAQ